MAFYKYPGESDADQRTSLQAYGGQLHEHPIQTVLRDLVRLCPYCGADRTVVQPAEGGSAVITTCPHCNSVWSVE